MYTINYNFNDISSHPSNCRRHGYFLQYPLLMYNGIFSYHPKQFHIQPYFQSLYYSIEEIKKKLSDANIPTKCTFNVTN